ncbi:unnamed protein product [Moneuplotes crassus]|uniref:Uncharacterized protein n=1 Tax=Euplotes crassus TaxID=5936 RepID=A0AAD1U739_EUPCR|nr:unnamed protein product [Moneuplotes crassus]
MTNPYLRNCEETTMHSARTYTSFCFYLEGFCVYKEPNSLTSRFEEIRLRHIQDVKSQKWKTLFCLLGRVRRLVHYFNLHLEFCLLD